MSQKTGTGKYEKLLERCQSLAAIPTAVAHPCEPSALTGAVEAAQAGLIDPILVGPAARIEQTAKAANVDLGKLEIVDAPHSMDAAKKAVDLVKQGRAEVLMKGSLHSDELLSAIVSRDGGLHWPSYQPRVRDGCSDISQGAHHHGCRDQYRADSRGQGRYLPERDRPRECAPSRQP